eukprot:Ihof_evm2s473 gene=Ihof_evmTU2s473
MICIQLSLPQESVYEDVRTVEDAWKAIRLMKVRGAPAIAIVAALGLAVAIGIEEASGSLTTIPAIQTYVSSQLKYLLTSRPTAVNLFKMADWLEAYINKTAKEEDMTPQRLVEGIVGMAESMLADDVATNKAIGAYGSKAIIEGAVKSQPIRILTHCNTGSLATAGYGTALGVIRSLFALGQLDHAYCTETRPYNQGARLTAYELVFEHIPSTLITDSMVSFLMKSKGITAVVVGADRIVANGDTANKIGTYQLAIAANYHNIPFYIAAPITSVDCSLPNGDAITIEERPANELTCINGMQIAANGIGVWNPSFDITPSSLIT